MRGRDSSFQGFDELIKKTTFQRKTVETTNPTNPLLCLSVSLMCVLPLLLHRQREKIAIFKTMSTFEIITRAIKGKNVKKREKRRNSKSKQLKANDKLLNQSQSYFVILNEKGLKIDA